MAGACASQAWVLDTHTQAHPGSGNQTGMILLTAGMGVQSDWENVSHAWLTRPVGLLGGVREQGSYGSGMIQSN